MLELADLPLLARAPSWPLTHRRAGWIDPEVGEVYA